MKDNKLITIPLGIDLEPFLVKSLKRKKINRNQVMICTVGRLTDIKNQSLFFDSIVEFTRNYGFLNGNWMIVGDGEDRDKIESKIKVFLENGIFVDLISNIKHSDMPSFYYDMDILINCSKNEGTPVCVIEAMASKVFVIATDVGGTRDLFGKLISSNKFFRVMENGILVKSGDSTAIANAIKWYFHSLFGRTVILKSAKNFVKQNYSKEKLLNNINQLYEELNATN